MGPFRFRAAAALEVRSREERAAEAALVHAEALFSAADRAWASARTDIGTAVAELERAARAGTEVQTIFWHRNWITRLTATADERRLQRERCDAAARAARVAWQAAKRRRMILERLRDRAFARHRLAGHRQELKVLDELARVRFTTSSVQTERSQE
jgi:flagellar export protein FliJ